VKAVYNAQGIKGLTLIETSLYKDNRGENFEGFDTKSFSNLVKQDFNLTKVFKNKRFVLDTFSKSKKSVFRGLHGDNKTWKLISCLFGEIHLTVLNPKTKKIARFKLDSSTRNQVLVPNDCVNGHYCLSDECLFSYKMTERYGGIKSQYTIKWYDPKYDFNWPFDLSKAIISKRDN
jgi:dTDP-4-dehydrorhamnose 3,5-epimerase